MSSSTVEHVIDTFGVVKNKSTLILARKSAIDRLDELLNNSVDSIVKGLHEHYKANNLMTDLITISKQEIERNEKGADTKKNHVIRWNACDLVAKFLPKAVKEAEHDSEDTSLLDWYLEVTKCAHADEIVTMFYPCLANYFRSVSIVDLSSDQVTLFWDHLWSIFQQFHSADRYISSVVLPILECLYHFLKRSRQTTLSDCPWALVDKVLKGLDLTNNMSRLWRASNPITWSPLLAILRVLLHDWGFSFRHQLITQLETPIRRISTDIDYTNTESICEPWSEIRDDSRKEEHAWLLIEEYMSLVAPKGCPVYIPDGIIPQDFVITDVAENLITKYAKISTSSRDDLPQCTLSNCRLVARAIVAQYSLPSTSGMDESMIRTQLMISQRRKRRRDPQLLHTFVSMDYYTLLYESVSKQFETFPTLFQLFVMTTLTKVFSDHAEDLGDDLLNLCQSVMNSSKKGTYKDELIGPLALLLTAIEKARQNYLLNHPSTSLISSRKSSTSVPPSSPIINDDGTSDLWSRALSWTHVPRSFDHAVRLLIVCDEWLLDNPSVSSLPLSNRQSRLLEVLRSSPINNRSSIDILIHFISRYEFDEGSRFELYDDNHANEEWRMRLELIDWLLSRDGSIDISQAIVSICSYFPRTITREDFVKEENPFENLERRVQMLLKSIVEEKKKSTVDTVVNKPEVLIIPLVRAVVKILKEKPVESNKKKLQRYTIVMRLGEMINRLHPNEEIDGIELLKGETTYWMEEYGVINISSDILQYFLNDPLIMNAVSDQIWDGIWNRCHKDHKLLNLIAITNRFMRKEHDAEMIMNAVKAVKKTGIYDVKIKDQLGILIESLLEYVNCVMDAQEMIVSYGYMIPSRIKAILIDKMSLLLEEEQETSSTVSYSNQFEEHIISFYSQDADVEMALHRADRGSIIDRIVSIEGLRNRLNLENDRGEWTLECVELVKSCLSPSRWEEHADVFNVLQRFPDLFKLCIRDVPFLSALMDEAASSIDLSFKKESRQDSESGYDTQRVLIGLWSENQKEISITARTMRSKIENRETDTCSMDDSKLATALLLPKRHWRSLLSREWNATLEPYAIAILAKYASRCESIGADLRLLSILEFIGEIKDEEDSSIGLIIEPLAEKALMRIHHRSSSHSCDFIRGKMIWKKIQNTLKLGDTPSTIRINQLISDNKQNITFDPEITDLDHIISTNVWWESVSRYLSSASSPDIDRIRPILIDAYRILSESRCLPPLAATVLPYLGSIGDWSRRDFDIEIFYEYVRMHIQLWFSQSRFMSARPETIDIMIDLLELTSGKENQFIDASSSSSKFSTDVVGLLLRNAYRTNTLKVHNFFIDRLFTVLPHLGIYYQIVPFVVSMCNHEEAMKIIISNGCILCKEKELRRKEKGRRIEDDYDGLNEIALIISESIKITGMDVVWKVCTESDDDSFKSLIDIAQMSIDSGVMALARLCIDIATDRVLPSRSSFLFSSSFTLPYELENIRTHCVIAQRDASTAASLLSSTQSLPQIRELLAESRFDWLLSSSIDSRAALDEDTEQYLLKFTQWPSFNKQLKKVDHWIKDSLILLQNDDNSSHSLIEGLRNVVSTGIGSSTRILSNSVRNDIKCLSLLNLFEDKVKIDEMNPFNDDLSSSYFDDFNLLRTNIALSQWKRKNTRRNRLYTVKVHDTVIDTVRHLEGIKAYKPALRLLSQWAATSENDRIRNMVALDEARIHVEMGEEYVALYEIGEIKKKAGNDINIQCRASFLEADVMLSHTMNREKSISIVKDAMDMLNSNSGLSIDDADLLHSAYCRLFEQTAKLLEDTQIVLDSRGFRMKKDAIVNWRKQLQAIEENRLDADTKTRVRLTREIQCEEADIKQREERTVQIAHSCIDYGLKALSSAPDTISDTSDILFPLLDIIFRYGQTDRVSEMIKDHIVKRDCIHWVAGVGHIVGHVFKDTLITKAFIILLARLVMCYPYNTLPRLLFYDQAGGKEEFVVQSIIKQAVKIGGDSLEEIVKNIRRAHFLFRDFTLSDLSDTTYFKRGRVNNEECFQMDPDTVSILRDQEALANVPMPTVHFEPRQDVSTIPYITRVDPICKKADGLSAPKKIKVTTSDGRTQTILCKKEDVRQDAMVEHLFIVINGILEKQMGRLHQELRTYKIVPLDINAGLIEFCEGTTSLKTLLCGEDRQSGLHHYIHPDDMSAREAIQLMGREKDKITVFKHICSQMRPVFRHYFYNNYRSPREWSDRLDAYRRSLAQWSMVCFVVGLGDRHSSNVLFEPATAKFVHIDLGMIFEYSKRSLPVPERVPFRLTRDLVDPLIGDGLDGRFTRIAIDTMVPLRKKSNVLLGVASVLLRETMTNFEEAAPTEGSSFVSETAIGRLRDKLAGTDAGFAPQTPEEQVRRLIAEATDINNLAQIFHGWMPFL